MPGVPGRGEMNGRNSFIYGVLIDSARLIEKHSYYFSLLRELPRWGYNTVFWHFTDDQGCTVRFKSLPELASKHAFTPKEIKSF